LCHALVGTELTLGAALQLSSEEHTILIKDFLQKFTVTHTNKEADGDIAFDDGAEEEVDSSEDAIGSLRYSNLLVSSRPPAGNAFR